MYFWSALFGAGVVALSVTKGPLVVVSFGGSLAVVALVLVNMPRLRTAYRARRHPV